MFEFDRNWNATEATITDPLRWRKARRVRVDRDLFHEGVPDEMIDRIFAVMGLRPQHTFQVLTKRPDRMREYARRVNDPGWHPSMEIAALMALTGRWDTPALHLRTWPLPNVWLGVSVEDQATADERVTLLRRTPAAVRFVSAEPLLGPIDFTAINEPDGPNCFTRPTARGRLNALTGWAYGEDLVEGKWIDWNTIDNEPGARGFSFPTEHPHLDWIIVGGESGPQARPMHPDWARSIRDQCAAAGVPLFFKQHGEFLEFDPKPDVEIVTDGSDRAQAILNMCTRPSWITLDGRHILDRDNLPIEGEPRARLIDRVGKKRAGRLLDGVEHNGTPEARS